ncbi:MAG: aminotransferase class I/II-fold pyridoxal phosphate-dependent enzyme [Clostridia bacterium]|nr:aminotransferase class I/II-fold pyridoxal phosphate-dependent enzyme [Clostridia bacterium]
MLIQRENPHGGDIYRRRVAHDFSANVSPLGTPRAVTDAVKEAAERLCEYPDPYCGALREALARTLHVSAGHIICGNGAAELIFTFAAACRPQRALIIGPTFCEYEQALRAAGCQTEYALLHAQDGFALPDWPQERISGYDVVVLCNPNNPTGRAYPRAQVLRLAEQCAACGATLLLDECFCDLTDTPQAYSLLPDIERLPHVFLLKAFTKSFGMAGIRLGYAVCAQEELLHAMCERVQTWNVSTPAQAAGLAALGCLDFVAQERKLIAAERTFLTEELARLRCTVYPAAANFILFQSELPLYEGLLERGILIRRCANFEGLDSTYYRCAVKTRTENTALLRAMEELIHG